MEKRKFIFTFCLIVMLLAACNPSITIEKVKVTFIDREGNEVSQVMVDKGTTVTPPTMESSEEYSFYCWSLDKEGTKAFDPNTSITSDTTIYSIWIRIYKDSKNGLVYQENRDGTLSVKGVLNPLNPSPWACRIPSDYEGMTINSIEDRAFSGCYGLLGIVIPSTITRIGECIFDSCYNLSGIIVEEGNNNYITKDGVLFSKDETSIIQYPPKMQSENVEYEIPGTVTTIGGGAFFNSSLTSITIPASVKIIGDKAFMHSSISEITLPDSLITIGDEAFAQCENLTQIEIPASVEEIGLNAFYLSLKEINVSERNRNYTSIDGVLFSKDMKKLINYPTGKSGSEYTVPDSVTSLEADSFFSCDSLEKVIIPDSVTQIGDCAFYDCENLKEVTVPKTLKSLGTRVFENCEKLTSIIIPETVTKIEERAFFNCAEITSIYIPASVSSIGNNAFGKCSKLERITVSVFNKHFTTKDGVLFDKSMSRLICYPQGKEGSSYTIPNNVTTLEPYAFNSSMLNTIILPNNLTSIREGALSYTKGLTELYIPESVTDIEPFAFAFSSLEKIEVNDNNKHYSFKDGVLFSKDLSALIYYPSSRPGTEYDVPSGVTTIKETSFIDNNKLNKIIIPSSVTSIEENAFYNYNKYIKEIFIDKPEGSISGAPWGLMYVQINWKE